MASIEKIPPTEMERELAAQALMLEDRRQKLEQENRRLQAIIIKAQAERDVALNELRDRDGTGRLGWLTGTVAGVQMRVPLYFGSPRVEMWDESHGRWYRSMWEILGDSTVEAKVVLGP